MRKHNNADAALSTSNHEPDNEPDNEPDHEPDPEPEPEPDPEPEPEPDPEPALYEPYTWELSRPRRCLICGDGDTRPWPVKVWNVPHKLEWLCYKHMVLAQKIRAQGRETNTVDAVLYFQAQYVLQQKFCRFCKTEKRLSFFFWPSGMSIVGSPDSLIVSEGKMLVALCPQHIKFKRTYCDE